MTWHFVEPRIGAQPITETSTTQKHPLGTILKAKDETFGEGEFIYLEGVANTDDGDWVEYDDDFQTSIASIALGTSEPLAVAMSDNVANQYGWYQISGMATVNKASTLSAVVGSFGVTSGLVVAAASDLIVHGGINRTVSSAVTGTTQLVVVISRPTGPGSGST